MDIKTIFRNLLSFAAGVIIFLIINIARSKFGVSQVPIMIILLMIGIFIGVKSKGVEFISFMGGYLIAYVVI